MIPTALLREKHFLINQLRKSYAKCIFRKQIKRYGNNCSNKLDNQLLLFCSSNQAYKNIT